MFGQRGLDASYETVRRWLLKFGSFLAADLSPTRFRVPNSRGLDRRLVKTEWRAKTAHKPSFREVAIPEAMSSIGLL